jgi:regulator of sigma E protease
MIGQPARNSGILEGDEIVSVNGKKPVDWSEFSYLVRNTKVDPLQLEIKRADKFHTISISRVFNGQFMAIGVTQPIEEKQVDYEKVPAGQAVLDAWATTWARCGNLLNGIGMLVTGKVSLKDSVGGPITIMRMMYKRATEKWVELINIVALISLILFLMNLLPLGVVDGGQILLCLIEGIKRSPVPIKVQIRYQQVGFALVIGLMSFAVFNDLKNLFLEVHNQIK